jgi:hypothetical protein
VDAEAAQEKHAARSRLSPEARQEAEETKTAEEDRGRAKSHMIREQMRTHSAAGERGQGGARGGGVQSRNVDTIARSTKHCVGLRDRVGFLHCSVVVAPLVLVKALNQSDRN